MGGSVISRYLFRLGRRLFLLLGLVGCVSPATVPAPLAEIPAVLTVPQDLSIEINELQGTGSVSGQAFGSFLKLQTIDSKDIQTAIDIAAGNIEENNIFLNNSLAVVSQREIPVEVSVFNFSYGITVEDQSFEVKFDFGIFDLDGDGVPEACSGCTCPVGCAPALSDCPSEAPENQLLPICFRIWVNNQRFMAGLFDRVPTLDNPQSGQFRILFFEFGDGAGSLMAITYDHQDPLDLLTDVSLFSKDPSVGADFFGRRRTVTTQQGVAAQSKKTPRLTSEFFDSENSTLDFQAQFFSHLDFIALESIPTGVFEEVLGLVDITPPICAQISSADPVAQVLCDDLDLALMPGDFPTPPELSEVALPPPDQFPETPTF